MKRMTSLLALALPLAAFAHAHLESAQPARGSTLQKSPDSVILQFNEQVALTSLKLQKKGDQAVRDLGPLPADESVSLSVPLPRLADGEYVLSYVAQSSDSHESRGTIAFRISASARPVAPAASAAGH